MTVSDDHEADVAAVRAVLTGDRNRFREIVDRYRERVFVTAFRVVGREAEAEDLTQQTFVEGYVALARYDQKRRLLTWFLRIAVNNCRDFLKSHKRRETSLQFEADGSRAMHAGHVRGPEQEAESNHRIARIQQALDLLDDTYRIPVLLRDVEGFSYNEIQQVLDLPLTTLKMRVVRGRSKLQQLLADLRDA